MARITIFLLSLIGAKALELSDYPDISDNPHHYFFLSEDGGYSYGFDTEDGTSVKQSSDSSNQVQGYYFYKNGDGNVIGVKYTAGVQGFVPEFVENVPEEEFFTQSRLGRIILGNFDRIDTKLINQNGQKHSLFTNLKVSDRETKRFGEKLENLNSTTEKNIHKKYYLAQKVNEQNKEEFDQRKYNLQKMGFRKINRTLERTFYKTHHILGVPSTKFNKLFEDQKREYGMYYYGDEE